MQVSFIVEEETKSKEVSVVVKTQPSGANLVAETHPRRQLMKGRTWQAEI